MKKYDSTISLLFAGILVSALLPGCSGGGSSSSTAPAQTPSAVIVTPSLGKFSVGTTVKLKKVDGTEIGSGAVVADGTSTITLPLNYSGPIVVEVLGGSGVQYYDENNGLVNFIAGKKLRAVMPSVKTTVGVTPLTNAAVVKLEAASGALAMATLDTINNANTKVGAAFGLSDILLPPTPVDAATATNKTLNIAKLEDEYALVLAALAKTAATGSDAAAVADALALDMKDDKLDGKDGTSATPTATLTAYTPANIPAAYQAAAVTFMDTTSQAVVVANPIVIVPDVSTIVVVTNSTDVSLAKAMFSDLRTTLSSLNNSTKTGFLDTQATSMNADLTANVAPDMEKVANRIGVFSYANQTLNNRNVYNATTNPLDFTLGGNPETGTPNSVLGRQNGTLDGVMKGMGNVQYCYTDPTAPTVSAVSCVSASLTSGVITGATTGYVKMVLYKLTITSTSTNNNTYSYTATRKNIPVALSAGIWNPSGAFGTLGAGNPTTIPAGSGTLNVQLAGPGSISVFTLNGTLPPSTQNAAGTAVLTGVDTVNIAATRTLLTGANYRFALTGSVASANIDPLITVPNATISIDSGSYADIDETNIDTTGGKMLGASFIITAKTAKTQFTGTLVSSAQVTEAGGVESIPASIVFNGAISDISSGGAGQILTGKMELTTTDFNLFNSLQPLTTTNYRKQAVKFTGTVQLPSRPLMKLVLTHNRTAPGIYDETVNYSYGTTAITGSRLQYNADDPMLSKSYVMNLSNQDGIAVAITSTSGLITGTASKSSANVATFTSATGLISYVDGFSESLN